MLFVDSKEYIAQLIEGGLCIRYGVKCADDPEEAAVIAAKLLPDGQTHFIPHPIDRPGNPDVLRTAPKYPCSSRLAIA